MQLSEVDCSASTPSRNLDSSIVHFTIAIVPLEVLAVS